MTLIERYKAWQHKRRWPVAEQLKVLRAKVQRDAEWLAHEPKLAALCKRYADLLDDKWMSIVHLSSANFRTKIGADPVLVKPAVGKVRFLPVLGNANLGPPHQTFYGASQAGGTVAILRVEIDPQTLLVLSSVVLNKSDAHERKIEALQEVA